MRCDIDFYFIRYPDLLSKWNGMEWICRSHDTTSLHTALYYHLYVPNVFSGFGKEMDLRYPRKCELGVLSPKQLNKRGVLGLRGFEFVDATDWTGTALGWTRIKSSLESQELDHADAEVEGRIHYPPTYTLALKERGRGRDRE